MPRERLCRHCGEPLPNDRNLNRRYCNNKCRDEFRYAKERNLRKSAMLRKDVKELPEHVKVMVDLAFGAKTDDVVRQIFREEVRENVTRYVRDNVLGAAEVMTQLLPRVLEGLARDITDEDWVVRSKAQALILKYAMSFAEKEGDKNDLGTLTVVHNVPLPDTKLGQQIAEIAERVDSELEVMEDFEKDWPVCYKCNKRKHPDAMRRGGGHGAQICSTCLAYKNAQARKV